MEKQIKTNPKESSYIYICKVQCIFDNSF